MKKIITYLFKKYCNEKQYVKQYLSNNHGSVQLEDGTWAVNQSDEYYTYCYGINYYEWSKGRKGKLKEMF